ncbi:VirB2 family type IV secretion system major pilin TrwL [Bartonella sp. F02]|uniref:VirB2 family type IV secretion system major pilin TrwL n=1 Tax=Bartonella sp. F02 TaxID=2967262 RepID=UPI0022A8F265|nr:VirB2 family type IV secretion system major pilin TrwL [Bartonella sp. F02]MCZ2328771.1 VirB2 family type IV secretion system major pilin TrwL [Bartonella sp. F02]
MGQKSEINDNIVAFFAGMIVFLMAHPAYARLEKARNILNEIQTELKTIVPIAATVILIGLAIGYAGRFIEKDTFIRWGIGVIVAGSALQITSMLFDGS